MEISSAARTACLAISMHPTICPKPTAVLGPQLTLKAICVELMNIRFRALVATLGYISDHLGELGRNADPLVPLHHKFQAPGPELLVFFFFFLTSQSNSAAGSLMHTGSTG